MPNTRTSRLLPVILAAAFSAPAMGAADGPAVSGDAKPFLSLDALRAKYADRAGHIADIDGVEVYYKDEGSGPAILMIHGSSSTLKTYDGVAASLTPRYRVIRYDIPPQGLSGPVSDEAAARLRNTDIPEKLLARLGVKSVVAVGVSSGGTLCMYLASRRPDLVSRLILSNAPSDPVDTSHMNEPRDFAEAQKEAKDTDFRSRRYWDLYLDFFNGEPDRITPNIREQYYDINRRIPEKNVFSLTGLVADHEKTVAAMGAVTAPTLLIWGARDPLLTPPTADILAGYLSHAQVSKVIMPDVGHYPPLEAPERFARIVAAYIEAVAPLDKARK
jgi:pimeloyl-ACP methyl ester carboxylesterase